jgi:hypothetical protein
MTHFVIGHNLPFSGVYQSILFFESGNQPLIVAAHRSEAAGLAERI